MIAHREPIETSEQIDERSPCERDLQIYAAVRVDGRRQVDVAAEFGLTQGRVSQIVRGVNHWRVGMGVAAELERLDRKSVDRWLEQLRIDKLYEETMELYRRSCEPRRKECRGKDHRGEWSSESIDHQVGNLQCLKFAGRLIELRSQLDADPPPDPPARSSADPPTQLQEYDLYQQLVEMRRWVVRRGDVPDGGREEYEVRRMIDELVGRKPHVTSHEAARQAEVNAAAAALMGAGDEPANEATNINNISAAGMATDWGSAAVSDCNDETSVAQLASAVAEQYANNCDFSSHVLVGSAGPAEPGCRRDGGSSIKVPPGRRDLLIRRPVPPVLSG